jgi:hypothetical protein
MTIIARFTVHSHPLIIGDLLLSGDVPVGRAPNIPTVGDTTLVYPEGSAFAITGLRQKINILADNLVVGWAGGSSIARTVIRELRDQNSKKPFTSDSIKDFFYSCQTEIKDQPVGFSGYVIDNLIDRNYVIGFFDFTFNAKGVSFTTDLFGEVCLLGTGADAIGSYLKAVHDIPIPSLRSGLKANTLEIAIPFALHLTGIALENEIRNYSSLYNFYGGGYEVATLRNKRFTKLDDITYMFWHVEVNGKEVNIELRRAFKYKYYNDMLAIRTLSVKNSATGSVLLVDSANYLIEPILRDVTKEEIANFVSPSMNSEFLCNYFLVFHREQGIDVFTTVNRVVDPPPPIIFTEMKGAVALGFQGSFLQEVRMSILKRFS